MMAYAVHLIAKAVYPSEVPDDVHDNLCSTLNLENAVHLLPNAVHLSKSPDVHDGICSTTVGKYST